MRNNHEQTGIRARFVRLFEQTPLFAPSLMMRLADYPAQMRRIPSCARFWAELTRRYPGELPRFAVGPRDTSGLDRWLQSHGYHREMSETVLVLNREAFHNVGSASNFVHEVANPSGCGTDYWHSRAPSSFACLRIGWRNHFSV